jgi:photosystem II stability/assembly factor-like uncharacterized protein
MNKPFHFFFFIFLLAGFLLPCSAQTYTWEKLSTEPYRGKQDDIYFVNETTGWYINGFGKIFHTSDGGITWEKQLEKEGTFFRCIAFIDSMRGFVGTVGTEYFPGVTDTIPMYRTVDGGNSWSPVEYKGNYVKGLCAIDIVKEQYVNHGTIDYKYHIYAVGRVGSPANFMVSHDDGATFQSMDMSPYCKALYDIKMFNKKEGVACASTSEEVENSHASLLRTLDGGKTWKKVFETKRPFEISWKIFFPSAKVGYATIQSYNPDSTISTQHFAKTTNGGKSWREYVLCNDYKSRSFGVAFIDDNTGFIGTMNTGFQTNDGGKSWSKIDLGKACNKIRIVHKPDGTVYGYAIGVNVFKLKKT